MNPTLYSISFPFKGIEVIEVILKFFNKYQVFSKDYLIPLIQMILK